jgi:TetR/AcrR family transcriptional regulator, regulator of cefoperazone and chloramphenicol sensitivity
MSERSPEPVGTRDRLLAAAERLFAQHGFAGTSVRDITEAAKANLGAVNYYFRSKEDLYAEVFARRAEHLREPVIAAAREACGYAKAEPARALRTLGQAFIARHLSHATSQAALSLFAREVAHASLPVHLVAREFVEPILDAFGSVIGTMRPDLPPADLRACAHAFFAQLIHIVKAVGIAKSSLDTRLDSTVRFTVAAVMNL